MPDAVSRRLNAERLVVLGWPRAILLQLAHPLVAAGVADHSSFRSGPLTAMARLHHTIRAMLAVTFGDPTAHAAAIERIRDIHRRVNGRLPAAAGIFPAGTIYSAENPDLVLWVHVTLLETIPMVYDRIVEPLTEEDRDRYCAEAASTAIELGARDEEVPRSWVGVLEYLDRTYASGAIAVSAQARDLAHAVVSPPAIAPLAASTRVLTIGLLPPHIRSAYGFDWSARDEQRLDRTCKRLRAIRRILPQPIALWPEARQ